MKEIDEIHEADERVRLRVRLRDFLQGIVEGLGLSGFWA